MRTISGSEMRVNFAATLDSVLENREEVVVTRPDKDSVVIVALDDYLSLQETAYLLGNPVNARRLLGSIECLEAGLDV